MTREQIIARRNELLIERKELQFSLDRIKTQVTSAKREAARTGIYNNGEWLISAEDAMRHKGREMAQICHELSALKSLEKSLNMNDQNVRRTHFERAFMAACKRRLSESLYASLIQEAEQEAAEKETKGVL